MKKVYLTDWLYLFRGVRNMVLHEKAPFALKYFFKIITSIFGGIKPLIYLCVTKPIVMKHTFYGVDRSLLTERPKTGRYIEEIVVESDEDYGSIVVHRHTKGDMVFIEQQGSGEISDRQIVLIRLHEMPELIQALQMISNRR